ncbi:MAG: urease accessory protein UreD [Pseudomonadota bacterium]
MQPRAIGKTRLSVRGSAYGTRLGDLFQAGALKTVFPRTRDAGRVDAVLVNCAGGVTGGDRFTTSARAGKNARLAITTQAAERGYRAMPGEVGHITTRLNADKGSRLFWLPQETILFDGCAIRRRLDIEIAPDSDVIILEPLILGRTAMGETTVNATFSDRISIWQDRSLKFLDGWSHSGNLSAYFDRPAVGNGARAMASLIVAGPMAERVSERVKALMPESGGASLIAPDLLAGRILARNGLQLRSALLPVLDHLTDNTLPICWRL